MATLFLKSKYLFFHYLKSEKQGFTLFETTVVLLVMMVLLSVPFFSSFVNQDYQDIYLASQILTQDLRRAQSLAQSPSFNPASYSFSFDPAKQKICGFGIHIDYPNNTYLIFADIIGIVSPLDSCLNSDGSPKSGYYQAGISGIVDQKPYNFPKDISLVTGPSNAISDVVFESPYLDTFITYTGSTGHMNISGVIKLTSNFNPTTVCQEVFINNFGQVNSQNCK